MIDSIIAPKSHYFEPAPPSIKNLLSKVKDSKDSQQLEIILVRFYNINSSDTHIKSLFASLSFNESTRKFASDLIKEKVISIMEKEYDFNHTSPSQGNNGFTNSLSSTFEPKIEDIFSGIIKKPITVIQNTSTQENIEDYDSLANQFLTNSVKDWPEEMGDKEVNSIWKTNSVHNSYMMMNNDNNKPITNQLSANSSFQKMDDSHILKIEEFTSFNSNSNQVKRFLKTKRLGVPIVLSNSCDNNNNAQSPRNRPSVIKRNPFIAIKGIGIGLKEISNYVNEIIQRAEQTSYKEISDEIIDIIQAKNYREEKNIRRRIYDSLNVMKSLKIFYIDKNTKKIVLYNNNNDGTQYSNDNIKYFIDDRSKIEYNAQISQINQEMSLKDVRLNMLKAQYDCLNCLMKRNIQIDNFIDNRQKIYFPFLIIEFPDKEGDEGKVIINLNEGKTQAYLAFNTANKLYGDVEAVLKLFNFSKDNDNNLNNGNSDNNNS